MLQHEECRIIAEVRSRITVSVELLLALLHRVRHPVRLEPQILVGPLGRSLVLVCEQPRRLLPLVRQAADLRGEHERSVGMHDEDLGMEWIGMQWIGMQWIGKQVRDRAADPLTLL